MKINTLLTIFAIIAIMIAVANISITLVRFSNLKKLTGYATGLVNVTIIQMLEINMSNATINWGQGRVDTNENNATLYTVQDGAPSVIRGNWTAGTNEVAALRLENIGNVNCTLTLQTGMHAYGMFGSAAGNPANEFNNTNEEYKWNITEAYANSCNGGDEPLNVWRDTNQSAAGKFCDDFNYATSANAIYIDFWLTIPYDATNVTTALEDTITATAGAT